MFKGAVRTLATGRSCGGNSVCRTPRYVPYCCILRLNLTYPISYIVFYLFPLKIIIKRPWVRRMTNILIIDIVTIQSLAGDSENRRNEGAFCQGTLVPNEPIGSGFLAPFFKALENKKSSRIALRLNSY
jgi:hypothetical protein